MIPFFIDRREVARFFSIAEPTTWDWQRDGLLPPTVSVGGRRKPFIRAEIEAIAKAYAAGSSTADVRKLVKELQASRADNFAAA